MGHGVSLNHQNQTQKNYEAKFSINQIIKDKIEKQSTKNDKKKNRIEKNVD